MKHNIGTIDRVVRVVVGVALLAYAIVGTGGLRWLGLVGVVPLLTALISFCPLYTIFGFSTCPPAKDA